MVNNLIEKCLRKYEIGKVKYDRDMFLSHPFDNTAAVKPWLWIMVASTSDLITIM